MFSASFGGNPGKVIDLWKKRELVVCVSQEVLSEKVTNKVNFWRNCLSGKSSLILYINYYALNEKRKWNQ